MPNINEKEIALMMDKNTRTRRQKIKKSPFLEKNNLDY